MKIIPITLARRENKTLRKNNNQASFNHINYDSFEKAKNNNKKIGFLGMLGIKKPLFFQNSDDKDTQDINTVYKNIDEYIKTVNSMAFNKSILLKLYFLKGRRNDYKGYIPVGFGTDTKMLFCNFDKETQMPTGIEIFKKDEPFKSIKSYRYNSTPNSTTIQEDNNLRTTITTTINNKLSWAKVISKEDKIYQEITFYPNGMADYLTGCVDENGENISTDAFLTFDRNNIQNCHYFEPNINPYKYDHYTYDIKSNTWKNSETLSIQEANNRLEDIIANTTV